MLDQTTKRKLDSARQILVGKVPDPKAQVEQITTALIYKFMDDMDKENEEVGLKTQFFVDDWKKFSWTKILDNKLSGQERLDLYVQAITNMPKNPHIPQLFRNIFKGAFLPYNDARTLSLFLKEINEFNYEHSENLGNAFEYLLSILGSQGDAGQFRTPRHIIDFIVEVVDPKKNETILDPACGTAGFLISAYKHILKQNKEKALTPDEKLKLMNNLAGYDISPDMVKLALVNMYLHGFPEPKIHEYDSLTSEKRWDETFDVILANPPFMTPKGGIVPHKRFSIQANRAEVLFVDYIVEHLTIKGRAGIIVPEGVIFQSNNAYTQLRKKLVEDGLFAVVSLPAGVFNPYAGVKTSVLLFDNEISKKTKSFLFLKIQNDGFDLGAQRREHNKNDLPLALEIIKKYKQALKDGKDFEFNKSKNQIAHLVTKDKIIATGDYNLSGDRYKEVISFTNQKWEMVELGEICEIYQPKTITSKDIKSAGPYKVFGANGVIGFYDKYNHEESEVLITCRGATCGTINLSEPKSWVTGNAMVVKPKNNLLDKQFLFYFLRNSNLKSVISGSAQPQITRASISPFKIPLPPIEVQKEIVEQIEVKQKAIEAAKAVIESLERERRYFGQSLRKLEGVEWVELEELCEINPKKSEVKEKDIEVSFVPMTDVSEQNYYFEPKQTKIISEVYKGYTYFAENDVLLAKITPCFENGKSAIARKLKNGIGFGSTEFIVFRTNDKTIPEWIYNFVANTQFIDEGKNHMTGSAGQRRLNIDFVRKYKIPLPPLEIQKKLVAEAEKEQQIINANRQLIEIYDQKISDVLSEI
ncbi:MAG: N-6 DNA methylase [Elusimicrobia bacterium]|nr:N-6 DNA methylase [Elusimicrobiota bacterium]